MTEVTVADELPHAAGPELSWREAYSFDLFDPGSDLGGCASVEIRPNEGAMHVVLDFFLDDGGFISARHVAPCAESTALLEVEGLRFALLEPLRRWRISYDGPAHSLASAADAGKREAWVKSRLERLIVDLEFVAVQSPPSDVGGFTQAGRLTGEVWVSGDRYAVAAPGMRRKAWGAPPPVRMARRFAFNFGDDRALHVEATTLDDGRRVEGWILREGRTVEVRSLDLETETAADSLLQKTFRATLQDAEGQRHELSGEVLRLAPLPDYRSGRELVRNVGFARAIYDGRTGFGVAEYVHQLDADGRPLEPVE